jgi:Zn-dependent peptidase ImmA (M78 family)
MPQNIEKDINMSGFCIKDRKYPYIFINTKESNQENIIVEPIGRQIFSLIFLLCYIGLNDYLLASGRVNRRYVNYNKIYSIAAEVLLPEREIADIKIVNLEQIRRYASIFKVTPSMFVMRCLNSGRIDKAAANEYFESLKRDFLLSKRKSQGRYNPISGFSKYNGKKLSHDVVLAYREKRISYDQTCNVLFMNRKSMGKDLVGEYMSRFG